MRAGEPLLVAVVAVDVESADAVHPLKFFEAVEWDLGSARDKLEKLGPLLFIK